MNNILGTLTESHLAVDLGCGTGSFNYMAYSCRIVGIDLTLQASGLPRDRNRIDYIRSASDEIPLAAGSADAVICNHTLEHFRNYSKTLQEIGRVLKPSGLLWISVPNGFGFDDALYRLLYAGGGHLNRFTFPSLVEAVQKGTTLQLLQSARLYSSFIYVAKRNHRYIVFALNLFTRLLDKSIGTQLSLYGWGFVFGRCEGQLTPLPSLFNVCSNCGAGDVAERLRSSLYRRFGVSFYKCTYCEEVNVFVTPPPGLL